MDLSRDWDYIERIAAERLAHNKTRHHVSDFGPEIEVIGAAGELAARYYLGLKPELHTNFDGGSDLKWRQKTVDVKSTKLTPFLEHRFLQMPLHKPVRADIILMTAVDIKTKQAVVVGYAYKGEVLNAPVNRGRHQPCREIPVRKLRDAWELCVPALQ